MANSHNRRAKYYCFTYEPTPTTIALPKVLWEMGHIRWAVWGLETDGNSHMPYVAGVLSFHQSQRLADAQAATYLPFWPEMDLRECSRAEALYFYRQYRRRRRHFLSVGLTPAFYRSAR